MKLDLIAGCTERKPERAVCSGFGRTRSAQPARRFCGTFGNVTGALSRALYMVWFIAIVPRVEIFKMHCFRFNNGIRVSLFPAQAICYLHTGTYKSAFTYSLRRSHFPWTIYTTFESDVLKHSDFHFHLNVHQDNAKSVGCYFRFFSKINLC